MRMNDRTDETAPRAGGPWFSARVRVVMFVRGQARDCRDTIHIFRAADWDAAQLRAVALGRQHEQAYENANGDPVRARLMEVSRLDLLAEGDLDGAEVHSQLLPLAGMESLREEDLDPDRSTPGQTI
jgi:hypothetical protein